MCVSAMQVSLRSTLLLAAVKLPLNVALILAIGAATHGSAALLLAARIELLGLATTLACNAYMRVCIRRERVRGGSSSRSSVGAAGVRPGGKAGACGGQDGAGEQRQAKDKEV